MMKIEPIHIDIFFELLSWIILSPLSRFVLDENDSNEQPKQNEYRNLIENIEFIHGIVLKKAFIYTI